MGKYISKSFRGQYSLSDLFSANTGLVNYLSEIDSALSDPDIFVMAATSGNLEVFGLPMQYKVNGSGAGLTWENAYYSTIGESIERYCLSVHFKEDLIFSTSKELKEKQFKHVGPEKWSLFEKDQDVAPFAKFEDTTPIAWTLADSLIDNTSKYVPACLVYIPYYYNFEEAGEKVVNVAISTGASCATSIPEGILKGICELIERDAFMIMWKNQVPCPKLLIDDKSGIFDIFKKRFERAGLKYDLYYTTLDLEMPSFFGVLSDTRGNFISRVVGGAAHPDPEVAALKTLLELVQGLTWKEYKGQVIHEVQEDFSNIKSFEDRMEMYAYNDMSAAFDFLPVEPSIKLSDIKPSFGYNRNNVKDTLDALLKLFKNKKYDVLAVDMTTIEAYKCGVYVTKVLIPDLEVMDGEHRYQYFGGKRWREIPEKLKLKKFDPNLKVNPYPHPYP